MPKRRRNKFRKRKARRFDADKENIQDAISSDIGKSTDSLLETPLSQNYVTPMKMIPPRKDRKNLVKMISYESLPSTELNIDGTKNVTRKIPQCSLTKLYSCSDKLAINHNSQAIEDRENRLCSKDTPKCSKVGSLQGLLLQNTFPLSRKQKLSWNQVNIYSPEFFDDKIPSSARPQCTRKIIDNIANWSFNGTKDNIVSPKTPKFDKNINLNNSYTANKVQSKENSTRNLRNPLINISGSVSYHSSQKLRKKYLAKSCRLEHNISKKALDFSVENNAAASCQNVFERLKRSCGIARNWFSRIRDICTQLGIQLKQSSNSVYPRQNSTNPIQRACNQCIQYKEDISKLSTKIDELKESQVAYKEQMEEFNQQLIQINEKVNGFSNLQSEVEFLKAQLKSTKSVPLNSSNLPPLPPSLPPPPPPPLPPPPPPLGQNYPHKLQVSNNKLKLPTNNTKPAISVDDILKVKLKKPSDRLYQPTPTSYRNSQPTISVDMLKTVTLRPISRLSQRILTTESQPMDVTLSPNSELCKLLKSDKSTTKTKRLRRVGGYSYDSVYKRKFLDSREREHN